MTTPETANRDTPAPTAIRPKSAANTIRSLTLRVSSKEPPVEIHDREISLTRKLREMVLQPRVETAITLVRLSVSVREPQIEVKS